MSATARILVVEDDTSLVEAIRTTLAFEYEVLTARRASEALKVLADHRVDLVLTDFLLPGLSGFTVLWYVKQTLRSVPVVFMTAYGSERIAAEFIEAGGRAYLIKPFEMRKLQTTVRRLVAAQQQAVEARLPVLLGDGPHSSPRARAHSMRVSSGPSPTWKTATIPRSPSQRWRASPG